VGRRGRYQKNDGDGRKERKAHCRNPSRLQGLRGGSGLNAELIAQMGAEAVVRRQLLCDFKGC